MAKKILFGLALFTLIFLGFILLRPFPVHGQSKVFTAAELSQYDGKDGHKAYFAYEGKVYDVTSSPSWKNGEHYGAYAGKDLTGKMDGAPHGTEVFAKFEVVGTFEKADVRTESPAQKEVLPKPITKKWYEGRIRIFGLSILAWSGILSGILFIFTFSTCFAMPWAKLPLPWKGSRIGPDPLDASARRMTWSSIHKHFVWWLVIIGLIHGVLGILQLLGVYL